MFGSSCVMEQSFHKESIQTANLSIDGDIKNTNFSGTNLFQNQSNFKQSGERAETPGLSNQSKTQGQMDHVIYTIDDLNEEPKSPSIEDKITPSKEQEKTPSNDTDSPESAS